MGRLIRHLLSVLALGVLVAGAAVPTPTVVVSGPTLIGFFPPVSQKDVEHDDGLREGLAHVQFALEDLGKCLAPRHVTFRLELTRSLLIIDGPSQHRLDFPKDWFHSVGIVLVEPGAPPVVVYATAGPSSLQELAPQAAWKLFAANDCKRYE